jgi:hypothetical protein
MGPDFSTFYQNERESDEAFNNFGKSLLINDIRHRQPTKFAN